MRQGGAEAADDALDVNAFLHRAHMLREGGIRTQHRDVLRSYQTGALRPSLALFVALARSLSPSLGESLLC